MSADYRSPKDVALIWAARGFAVFPIAIRPTPDKPGRLDKRPLISNGHSGASTDPEVVARLFAEANPNGGEELGAGMVPGSGGCVVIDADRHNAEQDGPAYADVIGAKGTWTTDTPTTGEHRYFRKPEGESIGNAIPDDWKGFLDVRGDRGWVVCPGTQTSWGEWKAREAWHPDAMVELPERTMGLLRKANRRAHTAPVAPLAAPVGLPSPNGSGAAYTGVATASVPWLRAGPYWERTVAGKAAELAAVAEGNRNESLNVTAYTLAGLAAAIAAPERDLRAEAESALMAACDRNGLGPNLATFDSGWEAGTASPWFPADRGSGTPITTPHSGPPAAPIGTASYPRFKDMSEGLRSAFEAYRGATGDRRWAALLDLARVSRTTGQSLEVAAAMARQGHFLGELAAGLGLSPDGLIRLAWAAAPEPGSADGVPASERYPVLDWHEVFARDADVRWLCEPVIERGRIVCIYSPAKAGKSLLSLEIAVGLATGNSVLGQPAGERIRVLYVDCENSPDDIRERLEDMGYGPDDLADLRYLSFPSLPALNSEEGGADLVALAREHGAALVVIDTTSRVVDGAEKDPEGIQGLYRHALLHLKREDIAVLRLDHAGKDASKGQRGTSAKNDDADSVWLLRKSSEESVTLVRERTRQHRTVDRVEMRRGGTPLRHTVLGDGALPPQVLEIAAQLDRLGLPDDAGRDRARAALKASGVAARNAELSQAVAHRKSRRSATRPSAGAVPDLRGQVVAEGVGAGAPNLSPAHGDRSPDSCSKPVPGQVGDRWDRSLQAEPADLSQILSPYSGDRWAGTDSPTLPEPTSVASAVVSGRRDGGCSHEVSTHACVMGEACPVCETDHRKINAPWPCWEAAS